MGGLRISSTRGAPRWAAWAGVSIALGSGCTLLLGEDKAFHEVDGTGGAGASTSATAATTASASGATGSGGSTSSAGASSSSGTSGSTASSSSSGGGPCTIGQVLISEIRSRGVDGPTDEFVELWNPTDADVLLDSSWTLTGRNSTALAYSPRWVGNTGKIPARGHFLIVGSGYTQSPSGDDVLSASIGDAESIVLSQNAAPVSVVCFYYDATSLLALENGVYTCAGMPVMNPHDDAADTNVDESIERKPGGAAGNCTDTQDNASDFKVASPSTPEDASSPPTPG